MMKLTAIHGTPLYVYFPEHIKHRVEEVGRAFPSFKIIYSVKVNPFEPILQLLSELGVGIDAASKNEVLTASRMGHTDIYYSAPGKTPRDITVGLKSSHLIADSLNELKMINKIAADMGVYAKVGVRVNPPNEGMANSRYEVMSGISGKFGIGWDEFLTAKEEIKQLSNTRINGLHVYFGSQLLDAEQIAVNFKIISQIALTMLDDFSLDYVNYGGGFGVPYEADDKPLDFEKLSLIVKSDASTNAILDRGVRCNIELGRYLLAQAGLFITTVADVKSRGGATYVIIDGGINAFFRPKFTGQFHRVYIPGASDRPMTKVKLVGNTCTPLDVFYEEILLPSPQIGDLVVFENAGAYGYSMSMLDFISFDKPAQVMAGINTEVY